MKQILITLFIFRGFISYSQNAISAGANVSFGDPFKSNGSIGIGGSAEFILKFTERSALRAYTGYDRFIFYSDKYSNNNLVPLKLGYQYFASHKLIFFGDMGVGIFFHPYNKTQENFLLGAGTGYILHFPNAKFLQLSAIYNYTKYNKSDYWWFTFRVGYGLSWGKKYKL